MLKKNIIDVFCGNVRRDILNSATAAGIRGSHFYPGPILVASISVELFEIYVGTFLSPLIYYIVVNIGIYICIYHPVYSI